MTERHGQGTPGGRIAEVESGLRASEVALHDAEERFQHLVDAITDYAVYMLDVAGNVTTWNEGARRIKGYEPSEIIGKHVSVFYTPEDRAAHRPEQILEIARKEGRFEEENWRLRKDGTRFWAAVVITALRDAGGHVTGFAKVTRDLTARQAAREIERKLEREQAAHEASEASRAQLERVNRALRALNDLALAHSEARTVDEVAAVIVEHGMRVAGSDTCFLYVLDDKGAALELLAHRGVAPEIVEVSRHLTSPETIANVRAGAATWVETAAEYERINPALAGMKVPGKRARAFWSVPLVAEGGPIGLLGMGFHDERAFLADERALVETLTKQCAQSLLRALRAEREQRAREWLSTTLRSIGDAVIATDTAGRVTMMNAVAEKLTGWREAEATERPLEDVFPIFSEQTRRRAENPVEKVLREGSVVGLANHTVLRSRSGVEVPIDDSAAPIRDARGVLFGVVLVFRDATVEKRDHVRREFLARAAAALASSLDYRTTLATVAQSAVPQLADWCSVDILERGASKPAQLAVAHVDPMKAQWARELGEKYPPDPHATTGVPQVIRSGKPELYHTIPPALLEAGAKDAEHLRIIRELKLESAMVVPLRGRDRVLGAMTFIYADSGRRYTEDDLAFAEDFARRAAMAIENAQALKQVEDARAEERILRREAEIASRAKDEFLATVSHELRTPLNAILGWTITLRGRNPPPETERALAVIERNARRQAGLIEDILDVSRIISGKLSLTLGPTNLAEVIDAAIESVTPAAAAKDVTIQAATDRGLTMTADSDRLQQIAWNLLANAVKFSAKGGTVSVDAYREGAEVCICVRDTGEGIPSEALPHVFEPFRQADASTSRKHGGLGLGLAIVKQLVTAHGGTVLASSEGRERGAQFVVRLPARAAVPAMVDEARAPMTTPGPTDQAAAPRLDGLTVLVVDDEEDARQVVEEVLRAHGAEVITAASGSEALDVLTSTIPDVVVSDVGMPEMDGYALLRKMRAMPIGLGGRTPAVALTAYARKEDAQRAFAAGFQMHVSKPVDPDHLVTVVGNLGGRTLS